MMAKATYTRRVYLGLPVPEGEPMPAIAGSVAADGLGTGAVTGSSHPDPKARGREAHLLLVTYIGPGIGSLKQRPPRISNPGGSSEISTLSDHSYLRPREQPTVPA